MNLRLLLLLIVWVPQTTDHPEPYFFRYRRSLDMAPLAAGGQICVPLDANVIAHSSGDLSDLRLYRGGHEVPYALSGTVVTSPVPSPQPAVLNLGDKDGHVVFDAHVTQQFYSTLEIQTNARDFVASVDISGSESSMAGAQTHLGKFTIFDLTGQGLTRSTVLHLPPSNFQYLHFTLTGPIKPGDITGLTVVASPERQPIYRTIAESRQVAQRGRYSIATFNIPARVPVERVEVSPMPTPSNFSRDVVVKTSSQQHAGPTIFSGTIFRVHTVRDGFRIDKEQYALDIPPRGSPSDTGYVHWTITVDHGDDVPLALASVRLAMRERRLCFDGTAGGGYALYYGDSTLSPPRYDYASLFQPQDEPVRATLAAEQSNPQYRPRQDTRPLTERYPAVLWAALILVVMLLGFIAVRTATHMQPRMPERDDLP